VVVTETGLLQPDHGAFGRGAEFEAVLSSRESTSHRKRDMARRVELDDFAGDLPPSESAKLTGPPRQPSIWASAPIHSCIDSSSEQGIEHDVR